MNAMKKGIIFALSAACLYAISIPLSKLLLGYMKTTMMAGFLYLGAGIGMVGYLFIRKPEKRENTESKLYEGHRFYSLFRSIKKGSLSLPFFIGAIDGI